MGASSDHDDEADQDQQPAGHNEQLAQGIHDPILSTLDVSHRL